MLFRVLRIRAASAGYGKPSRSAGFPLGRAATLKYLLIAALLLLMLMLSNDYPNLRVSVTLRWRCVAHRATLCESERASAGVVTRELCDVVHVVRVYVRMLIREEPFVSGADVLVDAAKRMGDVRLRVSRKQ